MCQEKSGQNGTGSRQEAQRLLSGGTKRRRQCVQRFVGNVVKTKVGVMGFSLG